MEHQCIKCGKCCNWNGIVHIFPTDYMRIINEWKVDDHSDQFHNIFDFLLEVYKFKNDVIKIPRLVLKNKNGTCVFYQNSECCIHKYKPMICKTAPYNYSILMNCEVKKSFTKICKPFHKLLRIPSLKKDNAYKGVNIEIKYELEYWEILKNKKFDEVYQISNPLKWRIQEINFSKNIEDVYQIEVIKYFHCYANAI